MANKLCEAIFETENCNILDFLLKDINAENELFIFQTKLAVLGILIVLCFKFKKIFLDTDF